MTWVEILTGQNDRFRSLKTRIFPKWKLIDHLEEVPRLVWAVTGYQVVIQCIFVISLQAASLKKKTTSLCSYSSTQVAAAHFTAVCLSHAVVDGGDTELLSDEAEEAVHPSDVTEWKTHRGDLEGLHSHCGGRSQPPREDAGIRPWHLLGPAGGRRQAVPTSR